MITFSKTKEENDQNGLNGVKQQAYNRLIESREEDEEKEKEDGGRDYDDDEMTGERNVTTNTATAMEDDSDLRYLSEAQLNKELMNKRSWEALVDGVVNIERSDEGQLMVQIRWKDGKESIHDNSTVNKKCPQAVRRTEGGWWVQVES